MTRRIVIGMLLLAASVRVGLADELTPLQQRGKALATRLCAACHAIGRTDQSPHNGAPPLRALDKDIDIDAFMIRLRDGLTSDHPDMATYRFSRRDAHAFVLYLRRLQAP